MKRSALRADHLRRVIMAHGVPLIQFVPYRNFALHVDKLFREYSGETLRARVSDAVLRWQCYGCAPEGLRETCRTVFNLETD